MSSDFHLTKVKLSRVAPFLMNMEHKLTVLWTFNLKPLISGLMSGYLVRIKFSRKILYEVAVTRNIYEWSLVSTLSSRRSDSA